MPYSGRAAIPIIGHFVQTGKILKYESYYQIFFPMIFINYIEFYSFLEMCVIKKDLEHYLKG